MVRPDSLKSNPLYVTQTLWEPLRLVRSQWTFRCVSRLKPSQGRLARPTWLTEIQRRRLTIPPCQSSNQDPFGLSQGMQTGGKAAHRGRRTAEPGPHGGVNGSR